MGRGDEHRMVIPKIVDKLEFLAEDDQGIAEELNEVSREQDDAKNRVADAMDKVDGRSKVKIFLIGVDYKNLGALRSEVVTTENHLEKLNRARERADGDKVLAQLDEQIAALEEVKANVESVINDNQEQFSLFGWLVKLFAKKK